MKYRVEVKPSAEKELLRLPEREFMLLRQHIESLANNPWPGGAIRLKAKIFWRVRVRRFRIIYRIAEEQKLVEVVRITRRNEKTYKGL